MITSNCVYLITSESKGRVNREDSTHSEELLDADGREGEGEEHNGMRRESAHSQEEHSQRSCLRGVEECIRCVLRGSCDGSVG